MSSGDGNQLDLRTAAGELGVHYQTAYRWVRSGRLSARLVDGKYLIDRASLQWTAAKRRQPTSPTPPSEARLARQSTHMHGALREGDERTAVATVRRLLEDGARITDVIQHVLVPPLLLLGQAWHERTSPIWIEHRASAIAERVLGSIMPNQRGRRRGTAMVAAVSGDRHSLPTTMAAMALRDNNWHVHHLGADMPVDQLLGFCDRHEVTIAVLTVTNPSAAGIARTAATRLRDHGTPTLVGGPGQTLHDLVAAAAKVGGQ